MRIFTVFTSHFRLETQIAVRVKVSGTRHRQLKWTMFSTEDGISVPHMYAAGGMSIHELRLVPVMELDGSRWT